MVCYRSSGSGWNGGYVQQVVVCRADFALDVVQGTKAIVKCGWGKMSDADLSILNRLLSPMTSKVVRESQLLTSITAPSGVPLRGPSFQSCDNLERVRRSDVYKVRKQ